MEKYLEDDEILNILEQSESGSWSASSNDGESDHLSVEELSSSEVSDTDDDSQNLNTSSTCFISQNKKENWSSTSCHGQGHQQVILAALLLATFFAKEQALHVMQNLNANQNLIHSNYSSEIHCWTRFGIGQMPKGCLYTKKI